MYFDKMNKEMLNIFKSSAQATLRTISMLENQTEQMASFLVDNSVALKNEGNKCVEQWIDNTKKNQAELQTAYDKWVQSVTYLVWNSSWGQAANPKGETKQDTK